MTRTFLVVREMARWAQRDTHRDTQGRRDERGAWNPLPLPLLGRHSDRGHGSSLATCACERKLGKFWLPFLGFCCFLGAQWGGRSALGQDMPTDCITSASVTEDNDMPYASGRR